MSQLKTIEQRQLEQLFQMGGGYILDFSNRTFEEFVNESVNVNIFDTRYDYGSGSKANRLRQFWKIESNNLVGKIIKDLIDYAEFINKDTDENIVSACRNIADRLLLPPSQSNSTNETLNKSPQQSVNLTSVQQPPRVFISYSWDNDSHKDWVRYFADELIKNGIQTILDQYDLGFGDDKFLFMEASVKEADAVLCICTPSYVKNANGRSNGVGAETSLITPQFFARMNQTKQFIPIVRIAGDTTLLTPDYLSTLIYVDFRDEADFSSKMEQLLRHLYKKPKFQKPSIGSRPF